MTEWLQHTFHMAPQRRGFHLITHEIEARVPEMKNFRVGIAHLFIHHTSASLTLNENADPTVRDDFESHFNRMVPERAPYTHDDEGSDDMPAHLKSSILGNNLSIPIRDGRFLLGTWQGIYLCEHRNRAGQRRLTITIHGERHA